jgi:hypothetical protein
MKTKIWLRAILALGTAWTAVGRIEAQAQPAWFNPSTPGTRCCFGMVFDPAVNSTLLFGGYGGPSPTFALKRHFHRWCGRIPFAFNDGGCETG